MWIMWTKSRSYKVVTVCHTFIGYLCLYMVTNDDFPLCTYPWHYNTFNVFENLFKLFWFLRCVVRNQLLQVTCNGRPFMTQSICNRLIVFPQYSCTCRNITDLVRYSSTSSYIYVMTSGGVGNIGHTSTYLSIDWRHCRHLIRVYPMSHVTNLARRFSLQTPCMTNLSRLHNLNYMVDQNHKILSFQWHGLRKFAEPIGSRD